MRNRTPTRRDFPKVAGAGAAEGGEPGETRPYFTADYHDGVRARPNGAGAKLFDLAKDPKMDRDTASADPGVAKKMHADYVVEEAGGPLPGY